LATETLTKEAKESILENKIKTKEEGLLQAKKLIKKI